MAIGPTPPGTGVIKRARVEAVWKSASPTLPGLHPTSITTAPGLMSSPRISRGPSHGRYHEV